jgi:hypothetical protein
LTGSLPPIKNNLLSIRAYCLLVSTYALEPRGDNETNGRVSQQVCETHDKEIIKELYEFARELEKMEREGNGQ